MYCSACNVESGPTLFCHVCDNYLPNPVTGLKAGLVRRFMAVILDDIFAACILLLSIHWLITINSNNSSAEIVIILVSCAALFAYAVAFLSALSQGMTPGKWILGIRAIDKRNGEVPGLGRMLVREIIGKFVSGFFAGLGFFWAIWDRDSQAWHDKLAGTVVVRRDEALSTNQPSSSWPAAACFAFFAVLALQTFSWLDPAWAVQSEKVNGQVASASTIPNATVQDASATTTVSDIGAPAAPIADETSNASAAASGSASQPLQESEAEIKSMLSQWAKATEQNDAETASSFYANEVDRYFLARNMTRTEVQQDKEAALARGQVLSMFRLEDINVELTSPDTANISLTKSYEVSKPGAAPVDRNVHSRLWLQDTDGKWQIIGEQDLLR